MAHIKIPILMPGGNRIINISNYFGEGYQIHLFTFDNNNKSKRFLFIQ